MLSDTFTSLKHPIFLKVILPLVFLTMSYAWYGLVFNVKAEYLSTDILIYFLVCGFIIFVSYIRQQPHLAEPWGLVFKNKIAMSSAVILCFFVVVGLMDSIHFRTKVDSNQTPISYSATMVSLLDVSLENINNKTEKTYSAPFSAFSYAKENFINENGVKYRAYPRLKYAGAHLNNPEMEIGSDLVGKFLFGLMLGILISLLVISLVIFIMSRITGSSFIKTFTKVFNGQFDLPWNVMLFTASAIIISSVVLFYMSTYYHVMGTDKVGQDVFYLTLKSIRTGLVIGTLTTLIMLPFAIALGVLAGYYKGIVDDIIQYIYTTLNSIPGILLIVAVMLAIDVYIENHADLFETAIERADIKLLALCAVLGITSWTGLCRLLRGEVFKLRELEYIQAAKALGVSNTKIIVSHIVPNIMHIVLIVVVLDFSGLVLAEAVLAYVGVGVDPSTISWGNMINSARLELAREPVVWWSLISAFSFMFALVLAANLFSDAIRDAFDPRSQGIK